MKNRFGIHVGLILLCLLLQAVRLCAQDCINYPITPMPVISCDGAYYWAEADETFDTSGEYLRTLKTAAGCDSMVVLQLTIGRASVMDLYQTACGSYSWNGVELTESGTYPLVDFDEAGCDQTTLLHLTISHDTHDTIHVEAADRYVWEGEEYTESGQYEKLFPSRVTPCDSFVVLDLTVYHSVAFEYYDTACVSYVWNDVVYTASGDYVQHFPVAHGCDSVVTLHLTLYDREFTHLNDSSCYSYTWNGVEYTASGDYTDTLLTVHGCDSVVTLHLTVWDSVATEFTVDSVCDYYTWEGQTYYESGDYLRRYSTIHGCDSVVTLHLRLNRTEMVVLTDTACDRYVWNNSTYTRSGTYSAQLLSSHGCDSLVYLHLTILNSSRSSFRVEACESYVWNDSVYTVSGTYVQHFTNAVGCDSTATLTLIVHGPEETEFADEACESYVWTSSLHDGTVLSETLTASGDYPRTLTTVHGCDSVVTLHLTLWQPVQTEFDREACEFYIWNGIRYDTSGDYVQHFTTVHGCDSAVTLHLTVHHSVATEFTVESCDTWTWDMGEGQSETFIQSGDFTRIFTSVHGCDSVVTLHLRLHRSVFTSDRAEACEQYTWTSVCHDGSVVSETYTASGSYNRTLPSVYGCDSTVTLRLTIWPALSSEFSAEACLTYTWTTVEHGGQCIDEVLTESGDYTRVLPSVHGCDSTVTLHLTIRPSLETHIADTVCEGEAHVVGGTAYTRTGYYTIPLTSCHGCDSIVYLDLTVVAWPEGDYPLGDICADAPLSLPLELDRAAEWNYTLRFDSAARAAGFRDVVDAPHSGTEITIPLPVTAPHPYTLPGEYSATLTLRNDRCESRRESHNVTFTVLYPASVIRLKWEDAIGVTNSAYNGGFRFSSYRWYLDGEPLPGADSEVLCIPGGLPAGEYSALLVREEDGVQMFTCSYRYVPVASAERRYTATATPTVLLRTDPVLTLVCNRDTRYALYDAFGALFAEGDVPEGNHLVRFDLGALPGGVCVLHCASPDGETVTTKLILR